MPLAKTVIMVDCYEFRDLVLEEFGRSDYRINAVFPGDWNYLSNDSLERVAIAQHAEEIRSGFYGPYMSVEEWLESDEDPMQDGPCFVLLAEAMIQRGHDIPDEFYLNVWW